MSVYRSIGLLVLVALVSSAASAQSYNRYKSRAGSGEVSFLGNYISGLKIDGKGGAGVDVSDDLGWGIGLGYNLNDHWNFGFVYDDNRANYKATAVDENGTTQTISHKLTTYSAQFNLQYNFSAKALTPFVQAGLGWTYIDSNIANGKIISTCWWDPWYGYICRDYADSYSDNSFSYNTALGLRWDFGRKAFMRASYGVRWMDIGKASGTPDMDVASFELGTRF